MRANHAVFDPIFIQYIIIIQHTPTSLAHVAFCCLSLMVFNPLLYQRAALLFAFRSPHSSIPSPPSCSPSFHFIYLFLFDIRRRKPMATSTSDSKR
jgi:hypothetical protein